MRRTLLFAIIIALSTPLAASPEPEVLPGLTALREGRFREARVWFDRVAAQAPEAPEGPFFQGFHLWWVLLDPPPDEADVRLAMEALFREAARRAGSLEKSTDRRTRERGHVLAGAALLLEAQSSAERGQQWHAAGLARRGHRLLTRAIESNPDAADALFALGAYDYYADNLPMLIKGLRWLLAIPGGDEERGIARLERAADQSRLFGTESLMLLAHIFSGGFEEDHRRALDYSARALTRHPASPLIALAQADLLFDLGRFSEATSRAREAMQRLDQLDPSHAAEVQRFAEYRIALCSLAAHDPIASLARAESALERFPPDRPEEAARWMRLLVASAIDTGRIDAARAWLDRLPIDPKLRDRLDRRLAAARGDGAAAPRAAALTLFAAGRAEEALEALEALHRRYPLDVRLRYDLGRVLQHLDRTAEAEEHLRAAAGSDEPELSGWALLRLGWAHDARGDREAARAWYERSLDVKKFRFSAAARDRLGHEVRRPPEG